MAEHERKAIMAELLSFPREWLYELRQWKRNRSCDACERWRPLRYSPPHGAQFCSRCYRRNS
jgi:hypothetical protein